jgi:hypothetical protein
VLKDRYIYRLAAPRQLELSLTVQELAAKAEFAFAEFVAGTSGLGRKAGARL